VKRALLALLLSGAPLQAEDAAPGKPPLPEDLAE